MIDPTVAAASISASANIASSASQAASNRKSYKYTKMLQQQQNAWNLEQWNRQNEYNSPKSVTARYREAGVNPALIASNGELNTPASSVQSASPSQFSVQSPVSPSQYIENMQNMAQTDLITKQAASTNADVLDKLFDYHIKNENKKHYRNSMLGKWMADVFLPDIAKEAASQAKTNNNILERTAEAQIQRANDEAAITSFEKDLAGATIFTPEGKQVLLSVYEKTINIQNQLEQGKLTKAQARYYVKQALVAVEQAKLIKAQAHSEEEENKIKFDAIDKLFDGDLGISATVKQALKMGIKYLFR